MQNKDNNEIILVGSGGCMRELAWQILESCKWKIIGFVDKEELQKNDAIYVGSVEIPYLGDDNYLMIVNEPTNVAICIASPLVRERVATKISKNENLIFPNNIVKETYICDDVEMGMGCIISMDVRISTNVSMGNFVFMNTGAMLCHDDVVKDFVSMSTDVKVAGNVTLNRGVELGMGAKVIQGISIGENTVVGAGSVVVKDIDVYKKVVGAS